MSRELIITNNFYDVEVYIIYILIGQAFSFRTLWKLGIASNCSVIYTSNEHS